MMFPAWAGQGCPREGFDQQSRLAGGRALPAPSSGCPGPWVFAVPSLRRLAMGGGHGSLCLPSPGAVRPHGFALLAPVSCRVDLQA